MGIPAYWAAAWWLRGPMVAPRAAGLQHEKPGLNGVRWVNLSTRNYFYGGSAGRFYIGERRKNHPRTVLEHVFERKNDEVAAEN